MRRVVFLAALVAVAGLAGFGSGQGIIPDKVSFSSDSLRKLLPPEGKLIEQGQVSKNYVGVALGHEVKAQGTRVYVGAKLGSPGVEFGDGYINLNVGAHVEIDAPGTPSFNATARVVLTVGDNLQVNLRVDDNHLHVEGDNLAGKAVVAAKKEDVKNRLRAEVVKQGDLITKHLQGLKLPPELKVVVITPRGIEVMRTRPVPPPPVDHIVSADLHFHTTTDDREGGIVWVEFHRDGNTTFAAFPPLPEFPTWEERSRHDYSHKFAPPIPMPDKIAFARIFLKEAQEKNIGWNFNATATLTTAAGKKIVFEGNGLRLDTTGGRYPATKWLDIPRVR